MIGSFRQTSLYMLRHSIFGSILIRRPLRSTEPSPGVEGAIVDTICSPVPPESSSLLPSADATADRTPLANGIGRLVAKLNFKSEPANGKSTGVARGFETKAKKL